MRDLFDVARAHRDLPLEEVETLLDHSTYQARLAAVCILDFKARRAGSRDERRPLYELYRRRRNVLVDGLNKIGWQVEKPKGTMFVWAPVPEAFRAMG